MVLGIILLSFGIFLFIATYYVSKIYIILIGSLCRFLNGLVKYLINNFQGCSSFATPFLAYIPMLFPNKIEFYMSIAEFLSALGFLLGNLIFHFTNKIGPLFGSLLYRVGGYITPFIVFGSLSLIIAIILLIYAKEINKPQQIEEHLVDPDDIDRVNVGKRLSIIFL